MKKLYIMLALIMSSFFFCTSVSASTFNYTINETDINYLLSEDFILLREKTIEYCNENNKKYVIAYDYGYYRYNSYIFDSDDFIINSNSYSTYITPNPPTVNYYIYKEKFTQYGSSTGMLFKLADNTNVSFYNFLDTNIENLKYSGSNEYIIQYNDVTYNISSGSEFPSLYKIYSDNNIQEEPEEVPNYEILNYFYTVIFEKINLLTTSIAENYVFLSIFVVFILIFVTELIRRYLM